MFDRLKNFIPPVGWVVGLTAFLTLFLELVIARFFMFYFGQAGSLFAIPYALVGIAIGGFLQKLIGGNNFTSGFYIRRLAEFSAGALILLFLLSNSLLPPSDNLKMLMLKTIFFGTMFLIPFFISGFLLAKLFDQHRERIGRLYFVDLVSGAIACFSVPVLFHFMDSTPIILIFLSIAFLGAAIIELRRSLVPLIILTVIIALTLSGVLFQDKPDISGLKVINNSSAHEVRSGWNEYSRLSLYAYYDENNNPSHYRMMQDDGVSNIYLQPYQPDNYISPDVSKNPEAVPWIAGINTDDILVLFAGCGKDMVFFDSLAKGTSNITGIELNSAVNDFCLESKELKFLRLKEFYSKPNVNLVIAEGRNYLEQHLEHKYDVVFISASGAPIANLKQASSRKYLETTEAYRQYLSHLRKDGMILFGYQTGLYRLDTLKQIHAENYKAPFADTILVGLHFIAYKPSGFSAEQRQGPMLTQRSNRRLFTYVPGSPFNSRRIQRQVTRPINSETVMTDDRPFAYAITWKSLSLDALRKSLENNYNFLTLDHQSRVLPVLFLIVFILIAYGIHRRIEKKAHRLKQKQIAYFMVSGFAYMCLQMGLIGKYDLFLGNPLYSMALITAVFLLSNGLGSLIIGRLGNKVPLEALAGTALIVSLASIWTADTLIPQFIGLHLVAKVPMVLLLIFPIGVLLGMFFPYYIALHKDDPTFNVSTAYGFSVLSSVLGGAYSLAVMVNIGYRVLLLHAVACYALIAIGVMISRLWSKKSIPNQ